MRNLTGVCRVGAVILLAVAMGPTAEGQVVSVTVGVKPSCPYGLAA